MNGVSERIQQLRLKAGIPESVAANALGLSIHEYGDLEAYDEEIIDVLSLKEARRVAAYFHQPLIELLVPAKGGWPKQILSPLALAELTRQQIESQGIPLEKAEDQLGWYLKEFLSDPEAFIDENPIMFLIDLAKFLRIDWLSTIPQEASS